MFDQVECVEDCGNGYGWSIISMGDNYYELAVLRDTRIVYDTSITSDVARGCWGNMMKLVERIKSL